MSVNHNHKPISRQGAVVTLLAIFCGMSACSSDSGVVVAVQADVAASIDVTPAFVQRGCTSANAAAIYCPD